jgi:hypothetical protein
MCTGRVRSRLFVAAAGGLAILAGCRAHRQPPREPSSATPTVEESDVARAPAPPRARAPVLWIGLDGLDWEILDRLAGEGRMPHWSRLVREGYSARLRSFLPYISPMLWATAATGAPPDVHRVLDFQEVDPRTGVKVPVSGRSRAVPAVWNLASEAGRTVGVVGWWATHPAEQVRGFFVSDRACPILSESRATVGVAYPENFQAGVAQVAAREGRVEDSELARWLGGTPAEVAAARSSGAGMESPAVALARILAATRVNHRIARDLYGVGTPA